MDLNDMQLWLDKARQSLTAVKAGDNTPVELTQPRIDYLEARIAELNQQKDREVQRYVAAVADLNSELAGLTAKPSPDQETLQSDKKAAKIQSKTPKAAKAKAKK